MSYRKVRIVKWLLDILGRWKERRYRKKESRRLYETYDENKRTLEKGGTLEAFTPPKEKQICQCPEKVSAGYRDEGWIICLRCKGRIG